MLLVLAMGLVVGMLGDGLRQVSEAEFETDAALHAQSLLEALGTLEPIEIGHKDGTFEDGRYRWTLDVAEIPDPAPSDPGAAAPGAVQQPLLGGPRVLRVVLDVAWGDGGPRQVLHLVTLRARTPTDMPTTATLSQ